MKYLVIKPFELEKKKLLAGDEVSITKKPLAEALIKNKFIKDVKEKD